MNKYVNKKRRLRKNLKKKEGSKRDEIVCPVGMCSRRATARRKWFGLERRERSKKKKERNQWKNKDVAQ